MSPTPYLRLPLVFCLLVALLPPVPAVAAAPPPFAVQPLAETGVKGLVWHDTDADGAQGGGEGGLPYVKLCLYEELDPPNGHVIPAKHRLPAASPMGQRRSTPSPTSCLPSMSWPWIRQRSSRSTN